MRAHNLLRTNTVLGHKRIILYSQVTVYVSLSPNSPPQTNNLKVADSTVTDVLACGGAW